MLPLLILAVLAAEPDKPAPKGHLVAVGGGTTTQEIIDKTLKLAGGPDKRIAILPQASSYADAGEASAKMWRDHGAKNVAVVDLAKPDAALDMVQAADLIWIPGGDQNRLMKALAGTKLPAAIAKRYQDGAVVGGTSAGAAVLCEHMFTGDAELDGLHAGATKTSKGLALWPAVLIDQHFLKRTRFNRLLSAVLDRPECVGIGIDESTAVIVTGSRFEVIGKSNVVVVDARKANRPALKPGEIWSANGVALHVLKAGDTFELEAREKSPPRR